MIIVIDNIYNIIIYKSSNLDYVIVFDYKKYVMFVFFFCQFYIVTEIGVCLGPLNPDGNRGSNNHEK
jgi:hypothetical protein